MKSQFTKTVDETIKYVQSKHAKAFPNPAFRLQLKALGLTDKEIDTQWEIAAMQNQTKLAAIAALSTL